jgi:hypothetical protein
MGSLGRQGSGDAAVRWNNQGQSSSGNQGERIHRPDRVVIVFVGIFKPQTLVQRRLDTKNASNNARSVCNAATQRTRFFGSLTGHIPVNFSSLSALAATRAL